MDPLSVLRPRRSLIPALIALAFTPTRGQAQTDWPTYGHDPGSMRYSPLKQIDSSNVGKLTRAWTYHMGAQAPVSAGSTGQQRAGRKGSEATPIVAAGMMFVPTPYNAIVALEPETGKEIWKYELHGGAPSLRGVEYWPGDAQSVARIFFGTTDGKLVALDAKTGHPAPGFGVEGFVDLKAGINNGFASGAFSLSSPPKIFKNVVITGARVQENPSLGFAGDTRGWDVRTGKLLWQFHSVPRAGEPGAETWEGTSGERRSGTNVWGLMSIDSDLGIVYLPHGSPTYDFYGADRKGANLYGNSLVALDALTGKLKWYFQAVHHDTWDYDLEAAPVLITVTRDGKRIPAVAELSKHGFVFILDRRNGKPVFGVEELPVPQSDVPGEHSWPTEPFPVKPAPLARMSFQPSDLAKVTPEHEQVCRTLLESDGGLHNDGPFTRYGLRSSIVFPGTLGASNWHGASYSPVLGYLFVNVMQLADVGKVVKGEPGAPVAYTRQGYGRFWDPQTFWPCQAPPWGEMLAIDVNSGDVAWRVPLGIVEELEAKGIRNTGAPNMGGSIATASGLVFIGATNDRRFRAFDGKTGKILWETKLEAGAYNTPITFLGKDGKQYVTAVAAGGGYYDKASGDSIVAFRLP